MKGSRNLTPQEVELVLTKLGTLNNRYSSRNQLLFIMGVKTGFRISELLSLKRKDVIQHGKPVTKVTVTRANMKGKLESRSVALHTAVYPYLLQWIKEASIDTDDQSIFLSQSGKQMTPRAAAYVLDEAFDCCRLQGKLGTHTMRKTFANNVHTLLNNDLVKTQAALGHKWISTTAQYIAFREEDVDAAVLSA